MFFASRSTRGADPFVGLKALLLVGGAAALLAGGGLGVRWLTWIGLGLLLVAFALRFARPPGDAS